MTLPEVEAVRAFNAPFKAEDLSPPVEQGHDFGAAK